MKNTFEPDLKLIAEAIGAALPRLRSGYSDYIAPDANGTNQKQTRVTPKGMDALATRYPVKEDV